MSKSKLEGQFAIAWRVYGNGIAPVTEYEFAASIGRRWCFDFAWPGAKVAVEADGGQHAYKGGRHATDTDRTKLNFAAAMGWRVLRFSGEMLKDPENVCRMVTWALVDTQQCGHPRSAIRGDGLTHWCSMCEEGR